MPLPSLLHQLSRQPQMATDRVQGRLSAGQPDHPRPARRSDAEDHGRENTHERGTSASVGHETLGAVVEACAEDKITLVPLNGHTRSDEVRYAPGFDIATSRRDEQEWSVLCLRIFQAALVYAGTLMVGGRPGR